MSVSRTFRQYDNSDSLLGSINEITSRWMPVQGWQLLEIQQKIRSGYYNRSPESWCSDISRECGLAGFVLRELGKKVQYVPGVQIDPFSPDSDDMNQAMSLVEETPLDAISKHSFQQLSKFQALQLRHSIASRASSTILATRAMELGAEIELPDVLESGVVRQIAQGLLAWNFPRYHAEAWESHKKGFRTADAIYLRGVGYGPQELANFFSREWHLSPEVRSAVAYVCVREAREDESSRGSILGRLNACSEVIARLTIPSEFPLADQEWQRYSGVFRDFVDESELPNVLRGVDEQLNEESEKISSHLGRSVWPEELHRKVFSVRGDLFRRANRYLDKCPESVRDTLCRIYDLVPPSGVSVEALGKLASVGLHTLGYFRGCVYVFSRSQTHLLPSLKLGDATAATFPPYLAEGNNPLVDAAFRVTPQRVITGTTDPVVAVQGAYQFGEVVGALTLEHRSLDRDAVVDQLYFYVFRHMLYDLLTSRAPE